MGRPRERRPQGFPERGLAPASSLRPRSLGRPLSPRLCLPPGAPFASSRSEEHTSELQSRGHLVCRLLLEKKKKTDGRSRITDSNSAPFASTSVVFYTVS